MQIIEHVFRIPDVVANTYVIQDDDGLTIMDAGLPGSAGKILRYVQSLGKAPRDVKRILITHADWDHVGGLRPLHKVTGARTYASRIEAEAMAAGRSSRPTRLPSSTSLRRKIMRLFARPPRFKVDEVLADDQVLGEVLGGLSVVDTAGHSPGHISFFAPSIRILFCGDSMITDETGIHGSRPVFTWDAALAQQAVRRQADLRPRILCSGHGPVIMDAADKFPL